MVFSMSKNCDRGDIGVIHQKHIIQIIMQRAVLENGSMMIFTARLFLPNSRMLLNIPNLIIRHGVIRYRLMIRQPPMIRFIYFHGMIRGTQATVSARQIHAVHKGAIMRSARDCM